MEEMDGGEEGERRGVVWEGIDGIGRFEWVVKEVFWVVGWEIEGIYEVNDMEWGGVFFLDGLDVWEYKGEEVVEV